MPLIYRPEELRQEFQKNKKGLNAVRVANSNDFPLGKYFGHRHEPNDPFVTNKQPGIAYVEMTQAEYTANDHPATPLTDFLPPIPLTLRSRPCGKFLITVSVPFFGAGPWTGGVALKIDDSQPAPEVAATVPTGAAQAPSITTPTVWTLDSTPNATVPALPLPIFLLNGPLGLAGWKSLRIDRVAPDGTAAWQNGQLAPRNRSHHCESYHH